MCWSRTEWIWTKAWSKLLTTKAWCWICCVGKINTSSIIPTWWCTLFAESRWCTTAWIRNNWKNSSCRSFDKINGSNFFFGWIIFSLLNLKRFWYLNALINTIFFQKINKLTKLWIYLDCWSFRCVQNILMHLLMDKLV